MRVTRVRISSSWQRNRISEPVLIFLRLESLTLISMVLLPETMRSKWRLYMPISRPSSLRVNERKTRAVYVIK